MTNNNEETDLRNAAPRSPLRVMQILHALAAQPEGLGLAKLSEMLGLPKTTLFNLLRSLESGGYVESHEGQHRIGIEAIKLGAMLQRGQNFPASLRPLCELLGATIDETAMIGMLSEDGREIVFAMVIETAQPLRFSVRAGQHWPLHSSAMGHTLLAFGPAEAREHYIMSASLDRFTDKTITTREGLAAALQRVREEGLSINDNGRIDGVVGMAAPIFGPDGIIVGVVATAAPAERMSKKQARIERAVKASGEEMSRVLGFRGLYPPAA